MRAIEVGAVRMRGGQTTEWVEDVCVSGSFEASVIWNRVDEIIDSSPGIADLRAHGLHLLAARRWRILGREIPPDLEAQEVQNAILTHSVPAVLRQVRNASDGAVAVMKGPVIASRFPVASRRPLVDLDLLVSNAPATYAALVAAGFIPTGDPATYLKVQHHLRPLRSPTRPLVVEVHSRPKWIEGSEPPPVESLLEEAVPADLAVNDVVTLAPVHHALVVAAHLWAHHPLTRLLRVLDVAVMKEGIDPSALESVARSWGLDRLWRTSSDISDALFAGGRRRPLPLRIPARGLVTARETTVVELQVGRVLNPFSLFPPRRAMRTAVSSISGIFVRWEGESWRRKVSRTVRQIANPSMRHSEHLRGIFGEASQQWQSPTQPVDHGRKTPEER